MQKVSVQANQLRLGQCAGQGAFRPSKDIIETEILILLGGVAAEARRMGDYAWDAASQDLREVRRMTSLRGAASGRWNGSNVACSTRPNIYSISPASGKRWS